MTGVRRGKAWVTGLGGLKMHNTTTDTVTPEGSTGGDLKDFFSVQEVVGPIFRTFAAGVETLESALGSLDHCQTSTRRAPREIHLQASRAGLYPRYKMAKVSRSV